MRQLGAAPPILPLTLALSGGGAKCAAQAGVLSVLAEAGLSVGAIAATSGGGLVAVLHGLGHTPEMIRDYIAETSLLEVWAADPTRRALIGWDKIRAHVRAVVGSKTFADLSTPVTVVASDLLTGREVHLSSGRLDNAILATMAIPGLFPPMDFDGMSLVDGAVLNPLPVDVARSMGRRVVAVDVIRHQSPDGPGQFFEARGPFRYAAELGRRLRLTAMMNVLTRAVTLTSNRLVDYNLEAHPPDVLIRPEVGAFGLLALDQADRCYELGKLAALAQLPRLLDLVLGRGLRMPWDLRGLAFWRRADPRRSTAGGDGSVGRSGRSKARSHAPPT